MFSQTTRDGHPPTPPSCWWPALFGAASDIVLFPSFCLVEHTLTAVCVQREISLAVNIMCIGISCDHLNALYTFDPTCIVLKSGWSSTARMPRLVVSPPSFSPSAPDSTAKPMASSHHFTPPRQVSARLAPPVWSSAVFLLSLVRNTRICCLVYVWMSEI